MVLVVVYGLGWRHDNVVPGVNPHGQHVLHVADDGAVACVVLDDLVLDLLPVADILLDKNLSHHACLESALDYLVQLDLVVCHAATLATKGVGHADYYGISQIPGSCSCLDKACDRLAFEHRHAALHHGILEELPILSTLNPGNLRSKHCHPVSVKGTLLVQLDAAVQGGLSAVCQHDSVWALLLYHGSDVLGRHRKEVHPVCKPGVRLYGGNIRIYQNALQSVLPDGFEALATGVVKLAAVFGGFRRLLRSLLPRCPEQESSLAIHSLAAFSSPIRCLSSSKTYLQS